jgi:hypothetical protein
VENNVKPPKAKSKLFWRDAHQEMGITAESEQSRSMHEKIRDNPL